MLRRRDRNGVLFDPWAHLDERRRKLLDQSWAGVFRTHLLDRMPVCALAPRFSAGQGRPSKEVEVALGVLVLQQMHDLSDEETVQAVLFDTRWQYALGLDEGRGYLCVKTLRNYRRRVIEEKADGVLFAELTDELIRVFAVDVRKQRLDSTAVRSRMAKLTRLGLFVECLEGFLEELRQREAGLYAQVEGAVARRYVERAEGCFAYCRPSEANRRLPEAARDLLALVRQFEATAAAGWGSFAMLRRLLAEQCEVKGEAAGRKRRWS